MPSPRQSRILALWTAAWLFVLLLVLVLRLGDLALQWPVLLVPVAWAAAVLLRGRRAAARRPVRHERSWPPEDAAPPAAPGPPSSRTRELPWLPEVPRGHREGHQGTRREG